MAPDGVDAIIDRIYAGAVEENAGGWHEAALMIEAQTGGLVALTLEDRRAGSVGVFVAPSMDAGYIRSYSDYFMQINPWLDYLPEHPGELPLDGDDLLDPRLLLASEYYSDWLKPQGLRYALGVDLFREPGRVMLLSLLLPPDRPPTTADRRLLGRLKPHLRRAGQVRRQLGAAWASRSTCETLLDRVGTALFLLDAAGRVVAMNSRAQTLLDSHSGVMLDARHCLRPQHAADVEAFRRKVAAATDPPAAGAGGVLALRGAGEDRLHVLIAPAGNTGAWLGGAAPAVAVFVHDPATTGRPMPERLAELFGLTQMEARILAAIAGGATVVEAAEAHGVAVSTVRHHLKHLFGKTGVNRQADLVRLVLQDPLARDPVPPAAPAGQEKGRSP